MDENNKDKVFKSVWESDPNLILKKRLINEIKEDENLLDIIYLTFLPLSIETTDAVKERADKKDVLLNKIHNRLSKNKQELYKLVEKEFETGN